MKIHHEEDYAALRRAAYPAVGEQLDAIYKLVDALRLSGVEMPADVHAYLAKIAEVKAKYSK